jgi:hypothetical protein
MSKPTLGSPDTAQPFSMVGAALLVMEFHAADIDWWDDLVEGELTVQNDVTHLSDEPGHKLTLNEDVVRAHLKSGHSFFSDTPWVGLGREQIMKLPRRDSRAP